MSTNKEIKTNSAKKDISRIKARKSRKKRRTAMIPGARVLFLHGLEGSQGFEKQKLLERCVGKKRFMAPDLLTKQTAFLFAIAYFLLFAALIATTVICFVKAPLFAGFIAVFITFLVACVLYYVAGRATTRIMLTRAIWVAENAFNNYKPNIIAASSFGAVVALKMNVPKCPMLLFSPAQDVYSKYMGQSDRLSINGYPYVLIIHGENDKTVHINDSKRLIGSMGCAEKCRLEIIANEGHSLKSISEDQVDQWLLEVLQKGRENVLSMAAHGNRSVDPSLFQESEQEGDTSKDTGTTADDAAESDVLLAKDV